MSLDVGLHERLRWVDRLLASPPLVHPEAENGAVWSTEPTCYRFMAKHVHPGARTLETGAGLSTALFAAWGCEHLSVVPFEHEADVILRYCADHDIPTDTLRFDLRPSEVALPELADTDQRDLVFVDGCHGFPMPIIDWFYGASLLRKDGTIVIDDLQVPQVRSLVEQFLEPDERWVRIDWRWKWIAFRRVSEGSLAESETRQTFFRPLPTRARDRVKTVIPLSVKTRLRSLVPRR